MNSKLSRYPAQPPHETKHVGQRPSIVGLLALAACTLAATPHAMAADAPRWMHALVNAPLPTYNDKMDAVRLFSEEILTVQPNGKIKTVKREAYKILRPGARSTARSALPTIPKRVSPASTHGAFRPRAKTTRSEIRRRSRRLFLAWKTANW